MLFLAEHLHTAGIELSGSLVVMGSEVPFPFEQSTSKLNVAGVDASATDGMPDLENINVPSRLASMQGYAGCQKGYVTDIATNWLLAIGADATDQVEMFACGPEPMLEAAAKVAARFKIPCQLCLEEFMACAVGGCAGCAVPVHTDQGIAMKRVCVDGPVFEARTIYPEIS
jgi:dihydroorotate dehydrogenase electron transfer subunit